MVAALTILGRRAEADHDGSLSSFWNGAEAKKRCQHAFMPEVLAPCPELLRRPAKLFARPAKLFAHQR
jgi:hypothetical protein